MHDISYTEGQITFFNSKISDPSCYLLQFTSYNEGKAIKTELKYFTESLINVSVCFYSNL